MKISVFLDQTKLKIHQKKIRKLSKNLKKRSSPPKILQIQTFVLFSQSPKAAVRDAVQALKRHATQSTCRAVVELSSSASEALTAKAGAAAARVDLREHVEEGARAEVGTASRSGCAGEVGGRGGRAGE